MNRTFFTMLKVIVSMVLLFVFAQQTLASEIPRMTKEQLKAKLGSPNLVVVDVRTGKDWKASEVKIKGAVRGEVDKIESWAKNYSKDTTLVIYCAWPEEVTSARVAQKLMEKDFKNVYALKGGWHEWFRAQYPTEFK